MITRIVKMTFRQDEAMSFEQIFNSVSSDIRQFEGCIYLELLQDIHHSEIYFTRSTWENEEALESYRNSELFKNTWRKVKRLFSVPPQAWSTVIVASKTKKYQ